MSDERIFEIPFSYRDRPGREVAVCGDFSSWRVLHPLLERTPGVYSGSVALPVGVYRYKFLLDRHIWMSDPSNSWLDGVDGFGNNTLVVGGSEPPLFFAPCRRCWVLLDGLLIAHAEVATGARIPEYLLLVDADGQYVARHSINRRWLAENRWLLRYQGHVPSTAVAAELEGYAGRWRLPARTDVHGPVWMKQGTIYSIFVDRWHRGVHSPAETRASSRATPSTTEVFYGGDLAGVRDSIHHMVELGADAICLTPVHSSESPHRYDARSFDDVDPRLGGDAALESLIRACQTHGLKLILDAAFTHCSVLHPAFRDLLEHQAESRYRDWFRVERFPVSLSDPASYRHYPLFPDQPLMNLEAAPVVAHFKQVIERWMRMGVDGIRFDAVAYGSLETWRELFNYARSLNPDVAIIVECVSDSLSWAQQHLSVQAATDYASYDLLVRTLGRSMMTTEYHCRMERVMQHRLGPELDKLGLRFIETHDTDRFLTRCGSEARFRSALTYLLLRPEPVLFLYGSEFAISSGVATEDFDSAWPDRLPMPDLRTECEALRLVRALMNVRHLLRNHSFGGACPMDTPGGVIGYERSGSLGTLRLVANCTDEPADMRQYCGSGTVLLSPGQSTISGGPDQCVALVVLFPNTEATSPGVIGSKVMTRCGETCRCNESSAHAYFDV